MQKQTNPKPLGLSMAKLVLVVSLIVGIGAVAGVVGYVITKPKCEVPKSDGRTGMPMREAPPYTPKSCSKNEDCGIDTCQQGRDKCVEIKYACEMGKCVFPNKTTEFPTPPYNCWEGKCKVEEVIIDETADLSSKALATEDWKTYRNEEYGFETGYPLDWKVYGTNTDSSVDIMSYDLFDPKFERGNRNGVKIQIHAELFNQITSLDKFVPTQDDLTGKTFETEKIVLNGYEARKADMGGTVYFLMSNDGKKGIIIFVWKGSDENLNKIADQILFTFKFTN